MSSSFFVYNGILFPTALSSAESLTYLEKEFRFLDDDILSVSYPKSGTHWMQEILGLIWCDGDPSWVQSLPVWERIPWIETVSGLQCALKSPPPRLLASHLPFHIFPKSFLHSKAKVIYTVRNPKDVMISSYHFSKGLKIVADPGTLEEYMEEFLSGSVSYGSWFEHVKNWMEMKDRSNFFIITYEELQQDLRESVRRICHFIGKELNSQQIDSVVENASFHKMKDNNMSNCTQFSDTYYDHTKGKLMRKGISGDWKNHLTVAQNEHFDRVYREKMQGLRMTFPWD
ncbi:sulfotransferase 2B1-like isoform X1 [Lacerta agilis]|uniref:sulfotransferase 2B1-like isoform X1 n=1 Tax=Lacerta agilis TaxID=80427 RepID=UPI001419BA83|nr:sulfotransferase 2B1-like isoform X1 [Lacerta agilis]